MSYKQAGFSLGWELDVWGRIRRLTEAARAQYFATEEARRGVITTLVSDVTSTYFGLREADLELEIAKKTRDVAERQPEPDDSAAAGRRRDVRSTCARRSNSSIRQRRRSRRMSGRSSRPRMRSAC